MKLHIITVGSPKLTYAKAGWNEYFDRLKHYHQLRVTHIADKDNNAKHILKTARNSYKILLHVDIGQLSSLELADFLEKKSQDGRELCFIIGGPEGLPSEVLEAADMKLSLSKLTLPHDLAMVVLLEALYRASTINAGHPYHK